MLGIKLCRIVLNFLPEIGGSIGHIVELSERLSFHLSKQWLVTRKYYDMQYDDSAIEKTSGTIIYREDLIKWLPQGRIQALSFIPFAVRRVLWLNRKYGIDIIQAHCVYTGIAAFVAGKILRKPVIWMAHGTDEASGRIQGITETQVTRIFRPDHLFALDDGSNAPEKFKRMLGDKKVTVVYHGIDTELFKPKYVNSGFKDRLGIRESFVVTSTSRLVPFKGVEFAISAFHEFLKMVNAHDIVLLIIGDGPLRYHLEKMSRDYGIADKVKFLGEIKHSDIIDYLLISDIVIATSTFANVNRSTLEAMACGKTVLTFNSGNIKRTFSDMENCVLAESGNVKDLANKLLLLHEDAELRKQIGQRARKFVEKNRNWETRIRKELKVFRTYTAKGVCNKNLCPNFQT